MSIIDNFSLNLSVLGKLIKCARLFSLYKEFNDCMKEVPAWLDGRGCILNV